MKSIVSLLIIASIAYVALGQSNVPSGFAITGCSSTAAGSVLTQCTACATNYVLSNQSSSCSLPCQSTACAVCYNGNQCYPGGCVANAVFNTLALTCTLCSSITGCATCTLASGVTSATTGSANVACSTCTTPTYASAPLSNGCLSCTQSTKVAYGTSTSTYIGVPNCYACTSTLIAACPSGAGTCGLSSTNGVVTCTQCNTLYGMMPATTSGYVLATGSAANDTWVGYTSTGVTAWTNTVGVTGAFWVASPACILIGASTGTLAAPVSQVAGLQTTPSSTQPVYAITAAVSGVTVDSWGNSINLGTLYASYTSSFYCVGTPAQTVQYSILPFCGGGSFVWAFVNYGNGAACTSTTTAITQYSTNLFGVCTSATSSSYVALVGGSSVSTITLTSVPTLATALVVSNSTVTTAYPPLASPCSFGYITGFTCTTWACVMAYGTGTGTGGCSTCVSGAITSGTQGGTVTCYTAASNCATQVASASCTTAAAGYYMVGSTATLCTSGVVCSGGCLSTQQLWFNGSCITGTTITNCAYYNATGFCIQCSTQQTNVANCTACSSNCAICTSATTTAGTNCTNCSTGYTLTSTYTCSNNNANAKSSNALLAGLAFISMIFYYIF